MPCNLPRTKVNHSRYSTFQPHVSPSTELHLSTLCVTIHITEPFHLMYPHPHNCIFLPHVFTSGELNLSTSRIAIHRTLSFYSYFNIHGTPLSVLCIDTLPNIPHVIYYMMQLTFLNGKEKILPSAVIC